MERKNYRFVRVTDNIEIPVPAESTWEEEQELIAKFKAEHDVAALEREAQQFGGNTAAETFPLEELIHELQKYQAQFDQRTA